MKTLVVYYSFSGNNEILARELRSRLGCEIYKIVPIRKRTTFRIMMDVLFKRSPSINVPYFDLQRFDHIVLVAPVWNGRIASPLKSFLKMEKEHIKSYSFITLCGGGGNDKVPRDFAKLQEKEPVSFTELKIVDLLPPDKRNKVRYTSGYRIQPEELKGFSTAINSFLRSVVMKQQRVH